MKNKIFEHLFRVALSDTISDRINKDITKRYNPIDNIFYNIDFVKLTADGTLNYKRWSVEKSIAFYKTFKSQLDKHILDYDLLMNHPVFKNVLSEFELREMIEDSISPEIITEEVIGLIKA